MNRSCINDNLDIIHIMKNSIPFQRTMNSFKKNINIFEVKIDSYIYIDPGHLYTKYKYYMYRKV